MMKFETIYLHDDQGYFVGPRDHQVAEGVELPPLTTKVGLPEGADTELNFYRWNGNSWLAEKKPTCAADLVGMIVSHKSQSEHDQELRDLVQKYGSEEGYRTIRGDELEWIVEKIPQEEIDAKEIDRELSEYDSQVHSLKDRMATAMLMDDQETVTALKAEYKALVGE